MATPLAFLKFLAKAVLNAVGGGVAGDFAVEVLPEVARDVWRRGAKQGSPEAVRAEVEALAALPPDDAARHAEAVAAEVAAGRPKKVQDALAAYLTQVPASIRRSLLPPAAGFREFSLILSIKEPDDLVPLLPPRLPHFKPGDRPPGVGDWELVELLGLGGFGEVWKACNTFLDEPVALKFCLDEQAARVLRNEAAVLRRVMKQGRHPGIVALLDTYLNGDPPCLKYEYVAGGDLAGLIAEWHQESPARAVEQAPRALRDLAATAGHFHRLDPPIVHRDLKPANVLVQRAARPALAGAPVRLRVADFGIGGLAARRALGRTWQGNTAAMTAALRGACTPLYASPQQQGGSDPDPRDDVYSLGVIWYQMLIGDLASAPVGDWQDELKQRGVSDEAVRLLASCVALKPERRPRDAAVLAEQLAGLGRFPTRLASGGCKPPGTQPGADPLGGCPPPPLANREEAFRPADDLAEQAERLLRRVRETHDQAKRLAKRRHDYAAAVQLLDALPERLRNGTLYTKLCWRRDRVAELDRTIRCAVATGRLTGLRPDVEELLDLAPERGDLRRLLDRLPQDEPPPLRLTNVAGMTLVLVPAGRFFMGSPPNEEERGTDEKRHEVEITQPFYLASCPVTQEQYRLVTGKNPSYFSRGGGGRDRVAGVDTGRLPVDSVTWYDAVEFCRRLSELVEERAAGRVYRLPSEAEWEYACRAGSTTPFHSSRSLSAEEANFDGNFPSGGAPHGRELRRTERVGSYRPNAWNLCDMHGNVSEWCADWYDKDYYAESPRCNPPGPCEGIGRVIRGGSWVACGRLCRSAQRVGCPPASRYNFVGFRIAVSVPRPR
ncbi:MAG: SUMF1/EgtB/PvdO family nonheme iron enzyme [Planctomycetes bacterium]|nr:SUMF1/EgtB/PvdO family nonheme iron enzyme [Planctomycetota bacterium]